MFLKRGKKGISPIIATVLLIAFAVSIGVMIMSVSRNINPSIENCTAANIKIELQKAVAGDGSIFCYEKQNNKIRVALRNSGDVEIERLDIAITGQDGSINKLPIPDSKIKTGDVVSNKIDFSGSGQFKAEIIPTIILSSGKETGCLEDEIIADPLPDCN